MEEREKQIEQIEAFLLGKLSEEENQRLASLMKSDPEFAKEVEAYRKIQEGFWAQKAREKHAKVATWSEELEEQAPQVRPISKTTSFKWLPLAASIAVVLGTGGGLKFVAEKNYSNEALLTLYQAPNEGAVRGIQDPGSDLDLQPYLSCSGSDCEGNIPILQKVNPEHPQYPDAQFCLGHCLFQAQQYTKAAQAFQHVLDDPKDFEELGNTRLSLVLSLIAAGKEKDPRVDTLIEEGIAQGTPALRQRMEEIRGKITHVLRSLAE